MAKEFEFEKKCPFVYIGRFLNPDHFNLKDKQIGAQDELNLRKSLYNVISQDVNEYCKVHNVENIIRPGDNIEILTSLLSIYDNIPVAINLKRTDFDQWQAWIYSTPLAQFAIYFEPSFYNLQSLTHSSSSSSRKNFEEFFNKSCSKENLKSLQNAQQDNIVLPAGCYDYSGRYPVFVRFSRNQRAAYPPYKLDMFVSSPADRESRLGKDVFVLGDAVDKARIKVSYSREIIIETIEKTLDAVDDNEWRQKLRNARELGKDIAGELSFGDRVFTLMLVRNRNLVLSSFGNWSVPNVVLQIYEKKYVRPVGNAHDDNTVWLNQMEWHGDLAGDLARLAECGEEEIDITAILKNKNLGDLCRQSRDKPAWFDSGLTARIPKRGNVLVKIWGRLDYNPSSTKPYVLRLFSIWAPGHPLNDFATCFVSPFVDLMDMLNIQDKSNLLDVMQDFADLFKDVQSQEAMPLEKVGFFKQNEIYCVKTPFYIGKNKKNFICAYFSKCEYYKGTATPYFLNFFYYENPYVSIDNNSRMQRAIEYMLIGNTIQNTRQPRPNILSSIREFKRIQKNSVSPTDQKTISKNEEDIFRLFLLAQKRAIVAQEQFRLERAERSRQRDAMLRRLFHQIGHYTAIISGRVSDLQKNPKGVEVDRYLGDIKKVTQDVNSSVEIFKVLTSDSDDLCARFNRSLIYGKEEAYERSNAQENVCDLSRLFYDSLYEGIGRILNERGKFEKKLKSYLAQYFTVERWEKLDISEKNKYLTMMKKDLENLYPNAKDQISKLSIDNLEREDFEKILNMWSYESIKKEYMNLNRKDNEIFFKFIKKYLFGSFKISGTEETYFDSQDNLSYNCIKSILDELCFNTLKYAIPGGALELECLHDEKNFILNIKNDMSTAQQYNGSSTGLQGCEGIVAMLGGEMDSRVDPETGSDTARFVVSIRLKTKSYPDDDGEETAFHRK